METFDSDEYQKIINSADIVVPDGRPLFLAQKLNKAKQIRGIDLTLALCQKVSKRGIPIGFYGSTNNVLQKVISNLNSDFKNLNVTYSFSPPFRKLSNLEDRKIVEEINASDAKILFVGLGCPKQEKWMAAHKDALQCTMIGVGAAFDFIAENKKMAPVWMQSIGLEWLFRLLSEPKRLWSRYLKHNPRFIWYFLLQLLGKKYD
jgi:N-acetylglucosaminyldiphosphoundecaprenol N-acetyl-beta-D-mannosaminyltransferase